MAYLALAGSPGAYQFPLVGSRSTPSLLLPLRWKRSVGRALGGTSVPAWVSGVIRGQRHVDDV